MGCGASAPPSKAPPGQPSAGSVGPAKPAVPPKTHAEISAVFDAIDVDKNGSLSHEEFAAAFAKLGFQKTPEQIKVELVLRFCAEKKQCV